MTSHTSLKCSRQLAMDMPSIWSLHHMSHLIRHLSLRGYLSNQGHAMVAVLTSNPIQPELGSAFPLGEK